MLRNLSKYYLLICCKQGSSTHFCHFLATAFVIDVLAGSNPSVMGPKMKGLHSWRPIKSVVGDEGCPRAAGAARAPLRRSAPRVLRWKTLRVSSAPHPCGFESHALGLKKGKASIAGGLTTQWWAMRDVRVRLTPPALASGLRPSRAALENAARFLSSAPWRVRIPCAGPKKERPP